MELTNSDFLAYLSAEVCGGESSLSKNHLVSMDIWLGRWDGNDCNTTGYESLERKLVYIRPAKPRCQKTTTNETGAKMP